MENDSRTVDSHAHVSSPDEARFPRLHRLANAPDFNAPVETLLLDMDAAEVERGVLIQPSLYGSDHSYLLECLDNHPSRFVGVALADPADSKFSERLAQMVREAPIKGVRFAPLIDPSRPWFESQSDALVSAAADLDLAICLLISPAHLDQAAKWIARHPASRIVIDHMARPDLGPDRPEAVCDRVARLSDYPNVWVKLSALPELSREPYPHRDTGAWARRLLTAFGSERLMWGSDFPYVAGAEKYTASLSSLREVLGEVSAQACQRLMSETAAKVFRLVEVG